MTVENIPFSTVHSANAGTPAGCPAQVGISDFDQLTSMSNLWRCWKKTCKGKYGKDRVQRFEADALKHLSIIQQRLRDGTFQFGPYRYFEIIEKKRRDVVDSPMKDRVVHRAIYDYLTPIWQKRFIHDSYGNIKGKGTLKAVHRAAAFARKPSNSYALHLDISKFFYSVPHEHLKSTVLRHIGDQRIRDLVTRLIDSFKTDSRYDHLFDPSSAYRTTRAKGMPLGNLTSQLFSNILLNELDHHAKETLAIHYFIRYVDDFLVFAECAATLHKIAIDLSTQLIHLGLTIHPKKQVIRPVKTGIPFLGFVIWPNHMSAGKHIRHQYHRAIHKSETHSNDAAIQSYKAWLAHTGAQR